MDTPFQRGHELKSNMKKTELHNKLNGLQDCADKYALKLWHIYSLTGINSISGTFNYVVSKIVLI